MSHQAHSDRERAAEAPGGGAPLVVWLPQLGQGDLALAGGKGANLGELLRAGLPVPAAFVVTTAAYDQFVTDNHLAETIAHARLDEPGSGARIRAAFEPAPIPTVVERAVLRAYDELGPGPVAVRSSATAEDLPGAAFAGQQDTFLNVIGAPAVLDAVRRCWASLWTDRAIAYRSRQQVDQRAVKLAVVVQRMVPAEAAGVMFTANPVTGTRDEILIDANPGLGEAIVAGLVTPDHFVLEKRSGQVRQQQPGRREVIVRARPEGGTEHLAAAPGPAAPVLAARNLRQLARLGARIERHFGRPQDIEWALAGGQLFIVQARPMTALPEPAPRVSGPVRMLAAIFAEMFPIRPYPLDLTTWVHAISAAAVEPVFGLVGIAAPPIEQAFAVEDAVAIRFTGRLRLRPTPAVLLAPLRLLWLAWRYDPARASDDPGVVRARAQVKALAARDLRALAWPTLLATVREALRLARPLAGEPRRRYFPRALLAVGMLRLWLALLGRGRHFGTLLTGAESATLAANRALEALAARVRSDPVLPAAFARHAPEALPQVLAAEPAGRAFLAELQSFLERFGHREVVLSTMRQPTWKDAPELVLGMVQGFAATGPRAAEATPAWQRARADLLAHPLLRLGFVRRGILRLLGTARTFFQIRENTHFDATRVLPVLRGALLEAGRRLADAGVLDAPESVFHLTMSDLERVGRTWPPAAPLAADLHASAERRRERRAALEAVPLVDPQFYRPPAPSGDALLRGTPGSPGVAEGPVRVIRDTSEFGKLRAGEVLVAPYTNPAWTPLFQRASALVVDGGAAGSHAAIVAREYGIPAVMGTIDGTRRLVDGQAVRVDGSRGLVFSARPPGAA